MTTVELPIQTCIRCGGSALWDDEEKDYKCLLCCRLMGIGKKVVIKQKKRRYNYYEKDKQAIIDYFKRNGNSETMRIFDIPRSTWNYLKNKWNLSSKKKMLSILGVTISEADIGILDDKEFNQLWLLVGKVVRGRK